MPCHNVRKIRGKGKGQFAKKSVVEKIEKVLKSVAINKERKELDLNNEGLLKMSRVVDLTTLGNELWCKICNMPLSLKNIKGERRYGLASILTIECMECHKYQKISTCNEGENSSSSINYPINLKLALGMIDAGLGETHINGLLTACDIPAISADFLKKNERKVGLAVEDVAKQSCLESIRLEKKKTLAALQEKETMHVDDVGSHSQMISDKNSIVELTAGYDAGWQKRGTGHSYNSLSGHSTLIGHYSGKIISYAIRCTTCRKCSLGQSKENHDCRKNYEGSAKAMEPDMAVQLINKNVLFEKENVRVTILIGDDDSSTIAAVRRSSSYEIEKWSDYNHTHKAMTSALYTLKISPKLIEYFSHSFSHAVKQNKGDAVKIENALRSVVPHAFGDHTLCGDWCAGKMISDDSYVHKNLPNGKPLQDSELRVCLTKIFSRHADNAQKISNCGSTQGNESANNMIATKSPKSRYYSSSESLSFRVAAAVCQKNIGCNYLKNVCQKLKILPAAISEKFRSTKDIKRQRKKILENKIEKKKRRLQLKKLRKSKNSSQSRREGVTYESGVAFHDVSSVLPKSTTEIKNHSIESLNTFEVIVFDLETTGLSKTDEICQIAACTNEQTFNCYIIPSKTISKRASEITGLQLVDGDLYYEHQKVEAFPARIAFIKFLTYLHSFKCSIILIAHNAFRFDVPRIINLASNLGMMEEFKSAVKGFSDSLIISKTILKTRNIEKKKFSIQALAADFLPESTERLHNAINDVNILLQLLNKIRITNNIIKKHTKSFDQILMVKERKNAESLNKSSLYIYKNKISQHILNKMAKVGINHEILQRTFDKNGHEGIRILFGESLDGKPRVTTNKKILQKVYDLFKT